MHQQQTSIYEVRKIAKNTCTIRVFQIWLQLPTLAI